MNQKDVIAFFDRLAPEWDAGLIRDEEKLRRILDYAGITPGVSVLDVGCGTGVLFPDYFARDVKSVTGIDISTAMIARARAKFSDPRLTLLAGDVETAAFSQPFDRCVVYNAFPHFPDPDRLLAHLAALLAPGGRLSVAHGMGRAAIDAHHAGAAAQVSRGLMDAYDLAALMAPYLRVDVVVSEEEIYVVSGVKQAV